MKRLLVTLALGAALTGCQYGPNGMFHTEGWTQPTGTNTSNLPRYGTWTHDPNVANGCNEWDSEPAAETDNQGNLCKTVLP